MGYWTKEKTHQNRVLILAVLEAKGGRIESNHSKPWAIEILHDLMIANGFRDMSAQTLRQQLSQMSREGYVDTLILGKRTHTIEVYVDKVPVDMQRDVEKLIPTLRWMGDTPIVAVEPTVEKATVVAPAITTGLSDGDVIRVALELLAQAVAMGSAPKVEIPEVDPNAWRKTKEQEDRIKKLKYVISELTTKNETLSKQQAVSTVRIHVLEEANVGLQSNLDAALKASANINSQVRDGIGRVLLGAPTTAKGD